MIKYTNQNEQTDKQNDISKYPDDIKRNGDKLKAMKRFPDQRLTLADRGDSIVKTKPQNILNSDTKSHEISKFKMVTFVSVSDKTETRIKDLENIEASNVNVKKRTRATNSDIVQNSKTLPDHDDALGKVSNQKQVQVKNYSKPHGIAKTNVTNERASEKVAVKKKDVECVYVSNSEALKKARDPSQLNEDTVVDNRLLSVDSRDSLIDVTILVPKVKIERKSNEETPKNLKFEIAAEKTDIKKLDSGNQEVGTKLEARKRIRDKYTVKLKKNSQDDGKTDDVSSDSVTQSKERNEQLKKSDGSDKDKKSEPETRRRPIIKTVSSKNGHGLYKSVAFAEQRPTKIVQISIPNEKPKPQSKFTETPEKLKAKVSRISIKEKPVIRVKSRDKQFLRKKQRKTYKTKYRKELSPERCVTIESPQTEVAKWAPSCINRHTKPYYEAWVNTTLAAISKSTKKDKFYMEKQSIIQSFQRALEEGPPSPELVYGDFSDERYTGKIRVIHR